VIALMAGAGLRVGEVAALTIGNALGVTNARGQRAVRVHDSKGRKSRMVVLGGWNSWVIAAVTRYVECTGRPAGERSESHLIEGLRRVKGGGYASTSKPLSKRGVQRAVEGYTVERHGETLALAAHDLRRTYAKLCKVNGMGWEALRANLGTPRWSRPRPTSGARLTGANACPTGVSSCEPSYEERIKA
jgi:site-specific recombinase XerD